MIYPFNNTKVYQTEMSPGKGNCFSACLATVLGLRIEEVPNFREQTKDSNKYLELVQEWLKDFEIFMLVVRANTEELGFYPIPDGVMCIAGGKSKRFGHLGINHACVGTIRNGYNFELLHDPYPGGTGFESQDDISSYWFFVSYNIAERLNGI